MKPQRLSLIGSAVLLAGALSVGACGPGRAPAGQPALAVLTDPTLETIRLQFNQAADQTRVVLLLSPT